LKTIVVSFSEGSGAKEISLLGWIALSLVLCPCAYAQNTGPPKKHHLLVLPVIARSIETSWSFGVAVSSTFHLHSEQDPLTRTSNLQGVVLYTLKKQFVAGMNGTIYFPGEHWILNEQASYSYFPDKFWGLGKTAPASNEESYSFKQIYFYLHPQRSIGNNLFLGIRYEFQSVWDILYDSGGVFDKQEVLGRYPYFVSGLGASITYDTRNNAFSPDRGTMLQFFTMYFSPVFGSDYSYGSFVLDLRRFLRIHKEQVLAMQAYANFNAGDVPLRSLAAIGGYNLMRGFYEGRFRDKNMFVLQSEYRVPVWWRLGVVAFANIGNVAHYLSEVNLQYLKYSFGAGIRFALSKTEKLNLRLDYGISPGEQNGFYLQLGEAF